MAQPKTQITVTIKDDLLRKINKNIKVYAKLSVQVGYYTGSTYPDGTPVSAVAAWHEFGTSNMPQRSFMRAAMKEYEAEIKKATEKATNLVATGKEDPEKAMQIVARTIAFAMYKKLSSADSWATPLAASTIARKGHSMILFDTAQLRNDLSWRVSNGSKIVAQGRAKNVRGFEG